MRAMPRVGRVVGEEESHLRVPVPEPDFLGFPFLPFRSDFLPGFLRIAKPCQVGLT